MDISAETCKRLVAKRYEDVILAINEGNIGKLQSLIQAPLTEYNFDTDFYVDGQLFKAMYNAKEDITVIFDMDNNYICNIKGLDLEVAIETIHKQQDKYIIMEAARIKIYDETGGVIAIERPFHLNRSVDELKQLLGKDYFKDIHGWHYLKESIA